MRILWVLPFVVSLGCGFTPAPPAQGRSTFLIRHSTADLEQEEALQFARFQEIATKLRTSIHGNGFDSRDPKCGVESIRAVIPIRPSEGLGLELFEVAHSATQQNRGLVLVSGVGGNAAEHTSIQEGDTIVGVSCQGGSADFKESTTGFDYDTTMDAIIQAKTLADLQLQTDGEASISLQLNRLVPRATVQVLVDSGSDDKKPTAIEALAGDNLRLLLKQNKLYFGAGDCGGEGICGSDMIEILEGEEFVDYLGSSKSKRRKACQTIVGRDNQEATIRIRFADTAEESAD